MSNPVHVTIYGQHFTVVTGEEPERVEALATHVDSLMRDIASRGVVDSNRAAMLACLHLADQVQSLQAQLAVHVEAVKAQPVQRQKLNDLLQLLDDELK
ncbi:cell division protein ZapA [Bryobacter aggregatus]|uniref:cell division protein ZapA n=1 Tax=Bryobacter aggregatus TaxID=360054 RepID=UPI0009B5D3E3|nr:cell division protein ZapA [Bryobacter aggregatus]